MATLLASATLRLAASAEAVSTRSPAPAAASAQVASRLPCTIGLRPLPTADLHGPDRAAMLVSAATTRKGSLRLAGLAPASPDGPEAGQDEITRAVQNWLDGVEGAEPTLLAAGGADRWGRTPVLALAGASLLNAALLRQGLAVFVPGDLPLACAQALQAEEDAARRAGLGIWRDGGPTPLLPASRPADILARSGLFTLVKGRVVGLGETRTRVYLNFGAVRSQDFTVSIQKRNLRKVEASGMRWTSWEGRRVRVRGVVVPAGGPLIEVSSPEDVERLD